MKQMSGFCFLQFIGFLHEADERILHEADERILHEADEQILLCIEGESK